MSMSTMPAASPAARADAPDELVDAPIVTQLTTNEATAPVVACADCGAPIARRYCAECGEARPPSQALTMRHLATELAEHVSTLDFKLPRTLWTLLRRPGQLTVDYAAGRRARYTRPLTLLVLVTTGLLLVSGRVDGPTVATMHARTIREAPVGSARALRLDARAAAQRTTRAALADRVERAPLLGARSFAMLLVPCTAVLLGVLTLTRRRPFGVHVLLAVHLATSALALVSLLYVIGFLLNRIDAPLGISAYVAGRQEVVLAIGQAIGSIVLACILAHTQAAMRRVYALGGWSALGRAVALLAGVPVLALLVRQWLFVPLVVRGVVG